MARYPEELETTMNRAAEAAVPELRVLLLDAIARIGFDDARAVIAASDRSAARYFRAQTQAAMETGFLPAVQRATRKLRVADAYNQVAGRAAKVGLVRSENANLDEYIARKALDGVYATMAEEERALRASPAHSESAPQRIRCALASCPTTRMRAPRIASLEVGV